MNRTLLSLVVLGFAALMVGCEGAVLVNNDAGRAEDQSLQTTQPSEAQMQAQPADVEMQSSIEADPAGTAQPAQAEMTVETTNTRVEKQTE